MGAEQGAGAGAGGGGGGDYRKYPKKREKHLESSIVRLSAHFLLSLLIFLVGNVRGSRGAPPDPVWGFITHPGPQQRPLEGLQRP